MLGIIILLFYILISDHFTRTDFNTFVVYFGQLGYIMGQFHAHAKFVAYRRTKIVKGEGGVCSARWTKSRGV